MGAEPQCRLESSDSCSNVQAAYDAAHDRLAFSSEGRFWKLIRHMHQLGWRGTGRRIAMIDSACDLNNPRLKKAVDYVAPNLVPASAMTAHTEHGTAVALLISEVAPDCRIDVYPVVREDGRPDVYAVKDAITAAAESDAQVINLSLGIERPAPGLRLLLGDPQRDPAAIADYLFRHKEWLEAKIPDDPACFLCLAASKAAAKGKLVFASAGNAAEFICCPARAGGVIGVGFQQVEYQEIPTVDGIGSDSGLQNFPARQSVWADIVIDGIDGVLGTSFASPLRAAAAVALGVTPQQHSQYSACISMAEVAMHDHMEWRRNPRPDMPGVLEGIGKCYEEALRRLPHVHCAVSSRLHPELPLTDASRCATCGYFFGDLYLNASLFYLERRDFEKALPLLEAARALWPWSGAAAANLGAAFRLLERPEDALRLYDEALILRPGFPIYEKAREFISGQMAATRTPDPMRSRPAAVTLPSVRPDPFLLPQFSGRWEQVSSSSGSQKKFSEELAKLVPGWELCWDDGRLAGRQRETALTQAGTEPAPTASVAVICDGQTIASMGEPGNANQLGELADFMAAMAQLLGWNMVKIRGGDEFLQAYRAMQLRRAMGGRNIPASAQT